jgi:hypothetical protein
MCMFNETNHSNFLKWESKREGEEHKERNKVQNQSYNTQKQKGGKKNMPKSKPWA